MADNTEETYRHPFVTLPRVMDDGNVSINVDDISMVVDNADESGIIEGTTAIYLRHGPAVAVNMSHGDVMRVLQSTKWVEERNFIPAKSKEEVN